MKAHTRETLRRKMARLNESTARVDEVLYSDEISQARLECMAIDAERLAKYCRFVIESQRAARGREAQS